MRVVASLLVILSLSIRCPAQKPTEHFDLKGEMLGETLDAFKKSHPAARCYRTEPEQQKKLGEDGCTVYRDISFAGLPASSDAICDQIQSKVGDGHNCWEGLHASFRGGKLIGLHYIVEAEGGPKWAESQVVSALTEKFGMPQYGRGWLKGNEILLVHSDELPVGQAREKVSVIIISLALNEDYAKKDI